MPRRPRLATGQFIFHVLNRAVQGLLPFANPEDCSCFEHLLSEALSRHPVDLFAYVVMPNHWHLVISPGQDHALSTFMKWLTVTHAQVWRDQTGTRGRGAVYQGRFKAIAVQEDGHFLQLCRYVERNPVRARLIERAEHWPWSSACRRHIGGDGPPLSAWPVPRPLDWLTELSVPHVPDELDRIRSAVKASRHYGTDDWRVSVSATLQWRSGARGVGRPCLRDPDRSPRASITDL
jgi:putative transposase